MLNYSDLSVIISKKIDKKIKQKEGIYFTPKSIIEKLLKSCENEIKKVKQTSKYKILEPSCGSCEFIKYLENMDIKNLQIDCIEKNKEIYEEIKKIDFKNKVSITNEDFLKFKEKKGEYNLILGNPPYFVCKKEDVPDEYKNEIIGRPNIFGIFILHSLELLKEGGIIAFVLPKSFMNASYYVKIRNKIKNECEILDLIDFEENNDFLDTQQATIGIIIKKTKMEKVEECKYSIKINKNYIFTTNSEELKKYLKNSTTISELGLYVKTGPVVWNENKALLTSKKEGVVLLYNTNITKDNKVKLTEFKNNEKQQYININNEYNEAMIVVNRGNGNSSYQFKYSLIDNELNIVLYCLL